MSISCSKDFLIHINSATYGHDEIGEWDTWRCYFAVDITGDCNGKNECKIDVTINRFGYTCNRYAVTISYNYLKVDYDCLCKYSYAKKI